MTCDICFINYSYLYNSFLCKRYSDPWQLYTPWQLDTEANRHCWFTKTVLYYSSKHLSHCGYLNCPLHRFRKKEKIMDYRFLGRRQIMLGWQFKRTNGAMYIVLLFLHHKTNMGTLSGALLIVLSLMYMSSIYYVIKCNIDYLACISFLSLNNPYSQVYILVLLYF